jgi:hypothetical protein
LRASALRVCFALDPWRTVYVLIDEVGIPYGCIKIKDAGRFLQSIASIHHVMITGGYMKAIEDALTAMNVSIITPSDFAPPEQRRG